MKKKSRVLIELEEQTALLKLICQKFDAWQSQDEKYHKRAEKLLKSKKVEECPS